MRSGRRIYGPGGGYTVRAADIRSGRRICVPGGRCAPVVAECAQTRAPQSGQNLAPSAIFAPQPEQFVFWARFAPHSGQNLLPLVAAPHLGHWAAVCRATSIPWVWSTLAAFWNTWSRATVACALASS